LDLISESWIGSWFGSRLGSPLIFWPGARTRSGAATWSVRSADRIYVLDDGLVVDEGAHAELMSRPGIYQELFTLQASQFVDDPVPAGDPAATTSASGD